MLDVFSIDNALPLLVAYGYVMYFLLTIIEGPIVTVIAGSLVALGYFNFWFVYLIAVAGDLIGDLLYYSLGRFGGNYLAGRKKFLGINLEHVKKIESHFANHTGKTLAFGKLTHAVGAPILLAAGMIKVPMKRFAWFNILATLPKVLVFVVVGYYFGYAYQQIDKYFNYAIFTIFIGILLLIGMYFFTGAIRKKFSID